MNRDNEKTKAEKRRHENIIQAPQDEGGEGKLQTKKDNATLH